MSDEKNSEGGKHMNLFRRGFAGYTIIGAWMLAACLAQAQQPAPVTASFAHIAFGGTRTPVLTDVWSTEFAFTNLGTSPASINLRWFAYDGQPLAVPVIGATRDTSHQYQLAANATVNVKLDDSIGGLTQGWVAVDITGPVEGQGIYRSSVTGRPDYVAAVPLMRHGSPGSLILMGGGIPVTTLPTPRSLAVPFDNADHATGIAIANITDVAQTLAIDFLDNSGAVLLSQSIPMGPKAHLTFSTTDPRLAGTRGIVRVNGDGSPYSAIAFVFGTGANAGPFATLLPVVH